MEFRREEVSLYYEVEGNGDPILLLHGNGEDHTYFDKLVPYLLNDDLQVIQMDMRGHGASSLGNHPLTFALFAEDVKALLDHLHISQLIVLGFSDGANTAMQFAIAYPHYVKALILNAGNLNPYGMKPLIQAEVVLEYGVVSMLAIIHKRFQKKQQVLNLMVHHPHIHTKQLSALQMPTLVIAGENDMIRDSHTKQIAASIPHALLVILSKGDHFIARKKAEEFYQEVNKFLQEVKQNGR